MARWAKGGLGFGIVVASLACGSPAEVVPPPEAPAPVAAEPAEERREGRERRRKKREPESP